MTLCSTPDRASIRFCLKSSTSCTFSARLAAPYFEIKCTEVRAVQWTEIWKFIQVLNYCTFGLGATNDAQNVRADTARGKDNDQHIKNDNVILQHI